MKGLIALGFAIIILLASGSCAIGVRNDMARAENGIKAQYKQNQNSFAEMTNSIREIAQVPEMAVADLERLTKVAIEGRFGKVGSQALVLFVQEQNPTLTPALYAKLQQVIESGRAKFANEQKMLLDKKNVYQNSLDVFPQTAVASLFGFPKIDLDEYDIVTSIETDEAFATKKAGPMKLRESSDP